MQYGYNIDKYTFYEINLAFKTFRALKLRLKKKYYKTKHKL